MPYSTQAWRSPVSGGKGRGHETGDKNGGKFRGKAQGRVHMSVAGQLCALCPRRRPSVWDDQLLSERARLLGPASHVILGQILCTEAVACRGRVSAPLQGRGAKGGHGQPLPGEVTCPGAGASVPQPHTIYLSTWVPSPARHNPDFPSVGFPQCVTSQAVATYPEGIVQRGKARHCPLVRQLQQKGELLRARVRSQGGEAETQERTHRLSPHPCPPLWGQSASSVCSEITRPHSTGHHNHLPENKTRGHKSRRPI